MPFFWMPLSAQPRVDDDDDDDELALAAEAELEAVLVDAAAEDHCTEVEDHDLGFAASAACVLDDADADEFLPWWRRWPLLLLPEQAAETTEAARRGETSAAKSMVGKGERVEGVGPGEGRRGGDGERRRVSSRVPSRNCCTREGKRRKRRGERRTEVNKQLDKRKGSRKTRAVAGLSCASRTSLHHI